MSAVFLLVRLFLDRHPGRFRPRGGSVHPSSVTAKAVERASSASISLGVVKCTLKFELGSVGGGGVAHACLWWQCWDLFFLVNGLCGNFVVFVVSVGVVLAFDELGWWSSF